MAYKKMSFLKHLKMGLQDVQFTNKTDTKLERRLNKGEAQLKAY